MVTRKKQTRDYSKTVADMEETRNTMALSKKNEQNDSRQWSG